MAFELDEDGGHCDIETRDDNARIPRPPGPPRWLPQAARGLELCVELLERQYRLAR